ncbi:MAG: hypothetical protein DRH15_08210 [Deltaproteobacteria bacterium]|nr:MAG: hypothetical protein DRH15_08210 [Deltaproteobacteria bacterium]
MANRPLVKAEGIMWRKMDVKFFGIPLLLTPAYWIDRSLICRWAILSAGHFVNGYSQGLYSVTDVASQGQRVQMKLVRHSETI